MPLQVKIWSKRLKGGWRGLYGVADDAQRRRPFSQWRKQKGSINGLAWRSTLSSCFVLSGHLHTHTSLSCLKASTLRNNPPFNHLAKVKFINDSLALMVAFWNGNWSNSFFTKVRNNHSNTIECFKRSAIHSHMHGKSCCRFASALPASFILSSLLWLVHIQIKRQNNKTTSSVFPCAIHHGRSRPFVYVRSTFSRKSTFRWKQQTISCVFVFFVR